MPAPGVNIIIDDQSQINPVNLITEDEVDRPIFMVVSSADKGPEEWKKKVFGQDFYDYYGKTPSFKKHGQPLIQAANIIDAGGYVTFKRVVARDATLANLGVLAKVTVTKVHKTDAAGNLLYIDHCTGNETTSSVDANGHANSASHKNHIDIQLVLKSVVLNGNDPKLFANTFLAANKHTNAVGTSGTYPLFLIMDNGRGVCNKRFRIYRDTTTSKPLNYVRYFIEVIENGEVLETIPFTMNPDVIENNRNMSLENEIKLKSKQLRCKFFEDEFEAFTSNLSNLLGYSTNVLSYTDPIFGTDEYGDKYPDITVATYPNISTTYGLQLVNGSNGLFGDCPIQTPTWKYQVLAAFNGSFSDEIYDLDNNRIDVVFDANYPDVVKRAIETLVNFREDCMYFRDMCFNVSSLEDIQTEYNKGISRSKFIASYINYYDIYDPYTKKEIAVTVMYDLARLFVKHFINGRTRPFCGQKYEIIIPTNNFVEGTLNFSPKHTPKVNQKAELDTLRANYLSFYEGDVLTMNSEYTSQVEYTQLSWIDRVLGIQEMVKAIRVLCPKIRYSFMNGDDLVKYKEDVQNQVINKYRDRFASCEIEYEEDGTYAANKILYAVIKVKFRDFIQTEIFKIIALNN